MTVLSTDPEMSIDPQIIARVASSALHVKWCDSGFRRGSSASTSNLLLVDFEGVTVLHIELNIKVSFRYPTVKTEQNDKTYGVW